MCRPTCFRCRFEVLVPVFLLRPNYPPEERIFQDIVWQLEWKVCVCVQPLFCILELRARWFILDLWQRRRIELQRVKQLMCDYRFEGRVETHKSAPPYFVQFLQGCTLSVFAVLFIVIPPSGASATGAAVCARQRSSLRMVKCWVCILRVPDVCCFFFFNVTSLHPSFPLTNKPAISECHSKFLGTNRLEPQQQFSFFLLTLSKSSKLLFVMKIAILAISFAPVCVCVYREAYHKHILNNIYTCIYLFIQNTNHQVNNNHL